MEIACPRCGLMRMVDELPSASSSERGCPRCVERAQLLGGELTKAERDSEASLSRRGEWHVLLRGLQRGPYSLAALRQLLLDSEEGGAALVWRAGMLAWVPAQELELLEQEPPAAQRAEPSTVQRARAQVVGVASGVSREPRSVPMLRPAAPPPDPGADTSFQQANTSLRPARASRAAGETTLVLPVYRAASTRGVWLRWLALASLASIAAVGAYVTLRRSPAQRPPAPHAIVARSARPVPPLPPPPVPPPAPAASAPPPPIPASADVGVSPVATAEPLHRPAPPAQPAESAPPANRDALRTQQLRVRAGWAPVRAATDPDADVVCSLARGTQLEALAQRPATHGRWFQVACDKHAHGWVHENYVRARRQTRRDAER